MSSIPIDQIQAMNSHESPILKIVGMCVVLALVAFGLAMLHKGHGDE